MSRKAGMNASARACAGIGRWAAAASITLSAICLAAPPAAPVIPATAANDSGESAPLFLDGTTLLRRPEIIQGVVGNPNYVIDQRQYDQAMDYFVAQIAASPAARDKLWTPDFSSQKAYALSVSEHRQSLGRMLGLLPLAAQAAVIKPLDKSGSVQIAEMTITLDGDFSIRALLFLPQDAGRKPAVIAIPDADQSPEEFAGIAQGMTTAPWLRKLLAKGVAVAIPQMVERLADHPLCLKAGGQDRRRVLWRQAFITGRSVVGLEVQQVIALANSLAAQPELDGNRIAVWGVGQGGMTALYAAAIDEKLTGATILDYFEQPEQSWQEPVDRMLYGQLNEFGDAEVAALIAPRPLSIVTRWGGPVDFDSASAEEKRAQRFYEGLKAADKLVKKEEASGAEEASAEQVALQLGVHQEGTPPEIAFRVSPEQILASRNAQFEGLYRYSRRLIAESDTVRAEHWKLASTTPQEREKKAERLRKELSELVGTIPGQDIPLNPRTRLIGETDKFLAYEVLLDTVPGVEAYGQLLVPRAVPGQTGGRLPAVICQHGFGGAPQYVSGVGTDVESNEHFYHRFGERLAEQGYVVFAPYVTVPNYPADPQRVHSADLTNPLVRAAAALGKMRTSLELAKLHRIVDFLQSLPFVNGDRIGYYGLSYGGYSAVWMPPLEPRLKFTIISGFFNDTRPDITDEDSHNSYWRSPDADFYGWNLLNRFSQTELIAAMWPRPVAIEWGLSDPTTTPEWHKLAWQDLKEKFIGPWEMTDKVVSEDYVGVHTIHGIGTFLFVDRWLRPERSAGRDYGCNGEDYCNWVVAPGGRGYAPTTEVPYVSQLVDSTESAAIRGRFYIAKNASLLTGMYLKVSRVGNPGDLVVKIGSREGSADLGELRLRQEDIHPGLDFWYELKARSPIKLDPQKLYWFEVGAASGHGPDDGYVVYGPRPLGAEDYPNTFGLSFRTLTNSGD